MSVIEGCAIQTALEYAKKGNNVVLAHQVNTERRYGAGISGAISREFPNSFGPYIAGDLTMGNCILTSPIRGVRIAHLVGQAKIRSYLGERVTDVPSLIKATKKLLTLVEPDTIIFMPLGIGCGRGGATWGEIYPCLDQVLATHSGAYAFCKK